MHALEIGSAGQVAFATRAVPAWHLLGTVFDQADEVSTSRMLELAHLNGWNVRLAEAPSLVDGTEVNCVTPAYYVLRDNPFTSGQVDRLAVVGDRYKVVQNEDVFAFGDALLDGGGQWETAGSIRDGRAVFGSLLLDREIVVGGNDADDRVQTYLLVYTSHDGTVGVQAMTTPVRVVCQNTLNMAIRGVKQSFKMRHTSTIEGRIAAAKEALQISYKYADAFEDEANALYETSMSNAEFSKIVTALYPKPEESAKGAYTRWTNKVDLLGDIFNSKAEDAPATNVNISGTAWAGLNALTERLDWFRTPRKGEVASVAEAASGFSAVQNAEKARIHSAILSFAKDKGAEVNA
jgi:phage/plasmid-like protein (TIGR03299 family)